MKQYIRIQVTFEETEFTALAELAERALRDVRDQVRFIVRKELITLGYIGYVSEDDPKQER